jgi:hypothetical protein
MTMQDARTVVRKTIVRYANKNHKVESVRTNGIMAPYFRLSNGTVVSYIACSLVKDRETNI